MSMSPPVNLGSLTTFDYRGWSLFEAIDALVAYDQGAVDSGTHDEAMRKAVRDHLDSMDEEEFRTTCAEFVKRHYLGEDALSRGYGLKDVKAFIEWLARLGIDI
jgi:hypothetical protein